MQATDTNTVPGYHPVTRYLHAALVLGVLFQLLCAVWMIHPEHAGGEHAAAMVHATGVAAAHGHGQLINAQATTAPQDVFGQWLMAAHRSGGVWLALIVLANLLWAMLKRGPAGKRQMAVLWSGMHWQQAWLLLQQLPMAVAGKKPLPEPGNALSLIVEMLGMLSMTAMALTGAMVWRLWAGPGGAVSETAELWMEVHGAVAVLLFSYLAGHVSMALLHWRSGDPVFQRILPWRSGA